MPVNGHKDSRDSHILASKVVCLDCGGTMHRGSTARDGKTHYLRCKLAHKTKSMACTPHAIRLDEVVRVVEKKIKVIIDSYMRDERNSVLILESVNSKNDARKSIECKEKELQACEEKAKEISRIISTAYADKVRGIITEADFLSMKRIYDGDTEGYQRRKARLEDELKEMDFRYTFMKNAAELLSKYTSFNFLTHETVNDFVDTIQIGERNASGEQQVVINWLF